MRFLDLVLGALLVLYCVTSLLGWVPEVGGVRIIAAAIAVVAMVRIGLIPGSLRDEWLSKASDAEPTTVAKAAEGYVVLIGKAVSLGEPMCDPVTGEECAWYKVKTFRTDDRGHRDQKTCQVKEATSQRPIGLRDPSGICRVFPQGAEISIKDGAEHVSGGPWFDHYIWRIRAGDDLKVVGWITIEGQTAGRAMCAPPDGRPFIIWDPTVTAGERRGHHIGEGELGLMPQGAESVRLAEIVLAILVFIAAAVAVGAFAILVKDFTDVAPSLVVSVLVPPLFAQILRSRFAYRPGMRPKPFAAAIFLIVFLLLWLLY